MIIVGNESALMARLKSSGVLDLFPCSPEKLVEFDIRDGKAVSLRALQSVQGRATILPYMATLLLVSGALLPMKFFTISNRLGKWYRASASCNKKIGGRMKIL